MLKQKFSYHTHTNSFGIYDGRNSLSEMLKQAEEKGYEEIGVTNHLCYHPNLPKDHTMFFSDFDEALEIYKRTIDEIRETSVKSPLKIYAGFEVDYFTSEKWLEAFEKIKTEVKADYYIGATHFLKTKNEDIVFNVYHATQYQNIINQYGFDFFVEGYWDNVIASVESGLFDFIAHLDVLKTFEWYSAEKWKAKQLELIEVLAKYNQPYEVNTSGFRKAGEQYPATWMVEALCKRKVPVLINDDAHQTSAIAENFEKAELLLDECGCSTRWKMNKK